MLELYIGSVMNPRWAQLRLHKIEFEPKFIIPHSNLRPKSQLAYNKDLLSKFVNWELRNIIIILSMLFGR